MKTKELIIQKSFILFLQKGYKEVSLNEILTNCGISKGAFYHHYKSKDELYTEVLNRFFFSYFNKQDVDYSNATLQFKIKYFINTFLEPYTEISALFNHNHLSAYFRFLFQAVNTYPEIRAKVNRHFYTKGYYLFQIIEQAKQNNEIRKDVDSKVIARQILSTIIGVSVLEGIYDISKVRIRFDEIVKEYCKLLKA